MNTFETDWRNIWGQIQMWHIWNSILGHSWWTPSNPKASSNEQPSGKLTGGLRNIEFEPHGIYSVWPIHIVELSWLWKCSIAGVE